MRYRTVSYLVFAAAIFLIPLLVLLGGPSDMQYEPVKNSSPSQPSTQDPSAPGADGQPGAPAAQPEAAAVYEAGEGGFSVYDRGTGKVLRVSAQEYVRGALAAELPPTFHPEALKAQAVAAHTYALNLKRMHEASPDPQLRGADLSADPKQWQSFVTEDLFRQRYGDLADAYWQAICEAADQVLPYVLTYEGEPIVAAYCSMSNGRTEDAANVWTGGEPYLVPVESFGDTLAPDYETAVTLTVDETARALRKAWPDIRLDGDPAGWLKVSGRSESGYVTQVQAGDQTVHGKELRSALGLRSSDFEVSCDGAQFTFLVRGYGHGVGLSQYGADYMARQGAAFDEILAHYYPGAVLALVKEG